MTEGPITPEGGGAYHATPVAVWGNENHAYHAGQLLGLLLKQGIKASPVIKGNDYTPWIEITMPYGPGEQAVTLQVYVSPSFAFDRKPQQS